MSKTTREHFGELASALRDLFDTLTNELRIPAAMKWLQKKLEN